MACQDTVIKLLSGELPLWQLFFSRSVIILRVLLFVVARRRGGLRALRLAMSRWVLARSAMIVATNVAFYGSLPLLDISAASAVYHTAPLFIVAFSALMLRERVGFAQVTAIALAFVGVLIVVRPAGDGFTWATMLPLAAALFYALAAVVTRGRAEHGDPWLLTLSLNIVYTIIGGSGMIVMLIVDQQQAYPFLTSVWSPLTLGAGGVVLALAAVSIGIHLLLARAYQRGPTSVVAAHDYSYLIFVPVWAFVLVAEVPGWSTIAGTVLIGVAGIWSLRRRAPGGAGGRSSSTQTVA